MNAVLSTRSLEKAQQTRLAKAGIEVECYDAIRFEFTEVTLPQGFDHLIFTSKNGVKGFLNNLKTETGLKKKLACYCVGEKTRAYLIENGFFVAKMSQNSADLGDFLVNTGEKGPFLIFTGNRNRPELKEKFEENGIPFKELMVYQTHSVPKKLGKKFDGILFFSPSGVQSFIAANGPQNATAICIGETTAEEARKHFQRVAVADTPTTDHVIDKLIEINPTLANT
ncbi:uroporphyrinogen-III synthase [Muriicola jejuensis]|uniref:Uroporphyrinogen-III synthase n=1 Tax=Muriicola jejuensis TaxID=504488 RepID=A0A6P0U9F6_9FLAO|nr:uroporphyrinogen-III synthase [Muriicola jejuensis]NER09804.1 uroporphyrinogen-III synthase [Muriicola jejuensis]SMP05607.1 uroporphyrinogen-III synthase [Muriicola jejuensis]